jgi:predicted enzyme related to lactoylglutathione lyase
MKPFVGWFEITGKDGPALQRFYSKLFGWSINDAGDHSGYGLVEAGEKGIADGIGASQDGAQGGSQRPRWVDPGHGGVSVCFPAGT